jgi:hypothetical protein
VGIVRSFFNTAFLSGDQLTLADQAVADMQAAGAVIVDNVELPDAAMLYDPTTVLIYDFKQDLNAYLASLGPGAPYQTLADIIAFNTAHPQAIPYGQDTMTQSDTYSGEPGTAEATDADRLRAMTAAQSAIDGGLAAYNVDALIFPSSWSADIGANAGYPSVIVPAGYGATSGDRLGITFLGTAFSESKLITYAYGYEQQTHLRVSPTVRNRAVFPCPVSAVATPGPEATAMPAVAAAAPTMAAAPDTPAPAATVVSARATSGPSAGRWRSRLAIARAALPGAARLGVGPLLLVGIGIAAAAGMVRRRRRRGVPR